MKHHIPNVRTGSTLAALLLGSTALLGCAAEDPVEETPTVVATTETVTENPTETPGPTTITETTPVETSGNDPANPEVGIPGSRFVSQITEVPEIDPAPYMSSTTYPQQPGLQFTGPDGTYCEMYAEEGQEPTAMCTHEGEGDVNAVSVHQGEPATTHNVNRIFIPHPTTQELLPGFRIVHGPVNCAVPEDDVRVMCAIDFYSFAVSREGVELG